MRVWQQESSQGGRGRGKQKTWIRMRYGRPSSMSCCSCFRSPLFILVCSICTLTSLLDFVVTSLGPVYVSEPLAVKSPCQARSSVTHCHRLRQVPTTCTLPHRRPRYTAQGRRAGMQHAAHRGVQGMHHWSGVGGYPERVLERHSGYMLIAAPGPRVLIVIIKHRRPCLTHGQQQQQHCNMPSSPHLSSLHA